MPKTNKLIIDKIYTIMEIEKFQRGQSVVVTTKNAKVDGIISDVDMNVCTFEIEYSVDYFKDGETWTMIGVPAKAIEVR